LFIAGHYGFGNTGDEASLCSMVEHLREIRPGLQITAATGTPEKTAAAFGIDAVLWSDAQAVFESVRAADLVIVGGGGIFHDYVGIDPHTFLTDNHWGIGYFTGPAMMAALCEKPAMLYAVGVGPLFSEHSRQFTKVACEAAAAITVRDAGSRELLESIGVAADRLIVTADPAFGFTAQYPAQMDWPGAESLSIAPRPRVAVALRRWDVGVHSDFWEREAAAGLDRFLRQNGGSVLFVPFERPENAMEDDLTVARRVHSYMKLGRAASVSEALLSPEQTRAMLCQCDLVVGMRLHSLILGMLAEVPVLALSYDAKVDEVMGRTGLQDFVLDIRSLDAVALATGIEQALAAKRQVALKELACAARRNAAIAIATLDRGEARPLLEPPVAAMLSRGIQAQLREIHNLRLETRRLFHETEYYQNRQSSSAAEADRMAKRVAELETERSRILAEAADLSKAQEERAAMLARADELAAQLAQVARDNRQLVEERTRLERLLQAEYIERGRESAKRDAIRAEAEEQIGLLTANQNKQRALLTSREAECLQRAQESAKAEERIAVLTAAQEKQRALLASLETECRQKAQEIATLAADQDGKRAHLSALEDELRKGTAQKRELSQGLLKAEELRRQVIGRVNQFQNKLAADVELYRAQRAWKVMVAIRKGYTLHTRRGFAAFLRWAIALPFAGPGLLQEYEPAFPDVRNYLPERLHAPHDFPEQTEESCKLADLLPIRRYDVIVLAIFDFDFRFQRPQQVAAEFARRGHRVFWVSPARVLPSAAEESYQAVPLRENLWEVRLRGRRLDLYDGQLLPQDATAYAASLKRMYRDFQISESCALLQFPHWRQLGFALREDSGSVLVYDCMDDWQNWTAEPRISPFNLSEERKLVQECDVLSVSSQDFRERHEAAGLSPVLVRNGADFESFASPQQNDLLANIPKPVIGYYGAIADWFDLDLVAAAAAARPQYSFVLIGQVHQVDTSPLSALPNVHLLGEKHYRELPLFLAQFDVCLIPFKLTALTKGVDPVKLYEYLSQGKPVVATELAELPRDSNLLYRAADAADFIGKIDLALEERGDRAKQASRVEYARANTWACRVDELDRTISGKFPMVSILIVTHNCEEFIEPCLDAVGQNTSWPRYEVIAVDNNSKDATKQILECRAKSNERLRFITQSQNLGFAAANNLAAQVAQGEYIVFLNPDTIVTPGWLGRLIRHCELDSTTGAVAAVTNFSGNETKIKIDYGNVTEMHKFAMQLAVEKRNQSTEISVAPLYCVVVPRAVWRKVGELDPGFRVGMFEDDDMSLRIRGAGYRIVAAEDCFVHHFGNGSFAKLPPDESRRIFEENRQLFERKWGISWQPHRLRPGVRPPGEEAKFSPAEFLHSNGGLGIITPEPLVVNRLHPSQTVAGKSFNSQASGASALVVECASATPNTVIVMGSTILQTSYGKENLLSGLVPPELYARPGRYRVYLLNDFGESNPMDFEVLAPGPPSLGAPWTASFAASLKIHNPRGPLAPQSARALKP
jgi:polysaccharide pyruvyl transferase CsaB